MTSLFKKITIKRKKKITFLLKRFAVILTSTLLVIVSLLSSYLIVYQNKIYPNTYLAGVNISGNKLESATSSVAQKVQPPQDITLIYQDKNFVIKLSNIDFSFDYSESVMRAYQYTRSGNVFYDFEKRVGLLFKPKVFGLDIKYDDDKLSQILSEISKQISIEGVDPSVTKTDGGVSINKGSLGLVVDQKRLKENIVNSLSFNQASQIEIPINNIGISLTDSELKNYKSQVEKYLGKSLLLKFEYTNMSLKDTDIFDLINPRGGLSDKDFADLLTRVDLKFERSAQNPKFVFENGKVTEFQPALSGIKVDNGTLKDLIIDKLNILATTDKDVIEIDIPVIKTLPEISTDKVNNLGIKELIGRGTSTYFHSIPGRIHNVALAANRINGTLVKPGETFSFNTALGDVSAFTGYQQAYIISQGKTILGDGGGVCQVSSTLFRAVLNAGLPVVERQAHAYRVGYYEQGSPPGFDATVFSPSPDFRFTNDTANHILIEAIADTKNYSLIFELYGTSDGRIASVSKPVTSNVSAPPPDIYQDDPTLPTGVVRQIDYKAWGAKVSFNYSVTRNGEEIYKKTFISNYKPWAAVYLKGTGPAN